MFFISPPKHIYDKINYHYTVLESLLVGMVTPIIIALGKMRQENLLSLRPACVTQ